MPFSWSSFTMLGGPPVCKLPEPAPGPAPPPAASEAQQRPAVVIAFTDAVTAVHFGPFPGADEANAWAEEHSHNWRHGYDVEPIHAPAEGADGGFRTRA